MPFTQQEIDEAFDLTCRFHGVDPEVGRALVGPTPLLGSDVPKITRRGFLARCLALIAAPALPAAALDERISFQGVPIVFDPPETIDTLAGIERSTNPWWRTAPGLQTFARNIEEVMQEQFEACKR